MDGETKSVVVEAITKGNENSCVKINVLFFVRAQDIIGCLTDMPLEVQSGSSATDCLSKLVATFPGLKLHCCCFE